MANVQVLLPGNRFRLYRLKDDASGAYDFVCLAVAITFNRTNQLDDATTVNCDNPVDRGWTKYAKGVSSWSLNFSGKTDPKRLELLEADFNAEGSHTYQILVDQSAAMGGKTYTGLLHIETLEIGRPEKGLVTFQVQAKGDGGLVTAAAAA